MKMNKLEAQIIVENTGNYYDEEMEEILNIYEELLKHVGFEDNRRDKRYIVKFHDICYYTPKELEEDDDRFWNLFDAFCEDQVEWLKEENNVNHIDEEEMLTRWSVGHYQAFKVDIPEITKENAIDIAMKVFDEVDYDGVEYVKNYIIMVNNLQAMEDNYMEDWIEFLRCGEYIEEKSIKEIEDKYKSDKERRK